MGNIPLLAFIGLLLGQIMAEYCAMIRTRTLRWRHKREWTYYAVAIPFKAMIAAAIVQHVSFDTQPPVAAIIAGCLLTTVGIIVRVRGHLALDGAFSQYVETAPDHRLVQSGMYAKIRHPMYVGTILLLLGMPLVLAATWAWIVSALGLVGIVIRIRKEEAFLIRELSGYQEYTNRTWRLLPYIY